MHIPSALRRQRDEIVATIAVYEARIEAARMDLAALNQVARFFDPEVGRDETQREFERVREFRRTSAGMEPSIRSLNTLRAATAPSGVGSSRANIFPMANGSGSSTTLVA